MALRRRRRDPEGRMPLWEHFAEFRRRLVVSAAAILLVSIASFTYYDALFEILRRPFEIYQEANPDKVADLNFAYATAAFNQQLNVSIFAGLILSSPVWLYQIWAFVVPGLTRREKRLSLAFIAAVVPLFLVGCGFAYWILPRSLIILYGFMPEGTTNIQAATDYFTFVTRFILAFGVAFLLPVFLVAFNIVGVLPARTMIRGWRPAVLMIFIFAAVATPTPDAYTMFLLAAPLIALFALSAGIAYLLDRRKFESRPDWLEIDDTEASSL